NLLDADVYFKFINAFVLNNHAQAILEFDTLLQKGFEGNVIIEGLLEEIRNIILCKNVQTAQLLDVSDTHRAKYYQYAQRLSDDYLISLLNVLNDCDFQYNMSSNKRLHVEVTLIKCCYISQLVPINQMSSQDIELKKKLINNSGNEAPSSNASIPSKENTAVVEKLQTTSPPPVSHVPHVPETSNSTLSETQISQNVNSTPQEPNQQEKKTLPKSPSESNTTSKIGASLLDTLIQKN